MTEILAHILVISFSIYILLLLLFWIGIKNHSLKKERKQPKVTVVIPAHNESRNIDDCLNAISVQNYPSSCLEVIVVNDRSTDTTSFQAERWTERIPGLRVLESGEPRYPCYKKNALNLGIQASCGELIFTTDADCRPPPNWITSTVQCFTPEVGLVMGYAPLVPHPGVLGGLLALQSLVVSALAAGSAGIGLPLTCSGRNLAYRRSAFQAIGGFDTIGHILGGDDVLLMRQISSQTHWKICFNPDGNAGVPSSPHPEALFNRQVRYQSKAIYYSIPILLLALTVYIFHLTLAVSPLIALFHPDLWKPFSIILITKILGDGFFLWTGACLLNARTLMRWFLTLELLSVPYVVIFCALGSIKLLRWK